jgi:drug/metabolite transporter (DMT)-like permease
MNNKETINYGASFWIAEIMLLCVAVSWGASYSLAKIAVLFYPVLGFLAVRFCVTSLLLSPAWFTLSRQKIKDVLKVGVPLGLILLSIFISETYGVSLTSASNSAFLISLCVVFTPFVEWLVLKARPNATMFIVTAISIK